MPTTLDAQKRLKELGHNPGELDGVYGPNTREAVREFQRQRQIDVQYPGTIGPKTLAALFPQQTGIPHRPWFDLAIQKKGLHEGSDYSELSRFLKSDGKTLGDPRRLPWCGDFVQTCLALTLPNEPQPVNPYLARNWLKFGKACEPMTAAVAVFWRGTRNGTSGHVGFVAGKGDGVLYILGGNQGNKISVAPLKTDRLLGCRWPSSAPQAGTHLVAMQGGQISINEA